jgi:hypothetical protein
VRSPAANAERGHPTGSFFTFRSAYAVNDSERSQPVPQYSGTSINIDASAETVCKPAQPTQT